MSSVESINIQPIDKTTVGQICSGQVVLNLATAVKELLENSIDAGANSIQIKLEEYGSDSIEVIDNGCGVEEVNFQALTLKHHTSKITEFADLYSVETFGFRGEALSSLCALSDVTITTQHKNAVVGATLKFDHNGIITSKTKTLRKVGTTVKLENLFSPLPIRRTEFLKNLKREFSKMCNVLYAYGLQSTGVRITCTNHVSKAKLTTKETQKEDESSKRSTNVVVMDTKGESIESNILSIFGSKQKQNLLKVKEVEPSQDTLQNFGLGNRKLDLYKFKLNGFISSCAHGCGRSSSDRQFYYINSRPVDNSKISKLVNDIYHQYNNHQDPFVVLNIKVAVGSFDMNLTPDKRQILIQHENLLLATIKESLHALFKTIPSTLDVHNVGLIKPPSEPKATTEVPDKLKMFKANPQNDYSKLDKKALIVSRLGRFIDFKKGPTQCVKTSPDETKPEVKNEICSDQKETVGLVPKRENLEESNKDETKSQNKSESSDKATNKNFKVIYETGKGCDDSKETSKKCGGVKMDTEDVRIRIRRVIKEYKRKLLNQGSEAEDLKKIKAEEKKAKRMKLDEGLAEDEKTGRKMVRCDVSLNDIKNLWFSYNSEEKGKSTTEVKFLTEIKPQNNERAENELKKEIKKDDFKEMDIIGQFNLGFIIAKLKSDIFIIDQHASDEKYNFETLKTKTVMQSQKLFNPEKLELTVDKEEMMVLHKPVFKKNGFDFIYNDREMPTRRISLTAIPMNKNYLFGKEEVEELLFFLENAPDAKDLRPSRIDAMFATRACRKSVMVGTPLDRQQMKKIVNHMGEIQHPWNCPHGRPTMRHLLNLNMIVSQEGSL